MKATLQILIVSIFLILPLNLLAQVEPTDNNGNGFRNVSTLEHLRWISENPDSWNDNFELDNDIDASDTENWNDGAGWSPIGTYAPRLPFTGIIEGNGYEIQNLYINRQEESNVGLFGSSYGLVKNIGVRNVHISGGPYNIGGIVGINGGVLINCHTSGMLSGFEQVGGLVGLCRGLMSNCNSEVEVLGRSDVGGLVGYKGSGSILNCYSNGVVIGNHNIGGIAGYFVTGTIQNTLSKSKVQGDRSVGGFVGLLSKGKIYNSLSTSEVQAETYFGGGFIGYNSVGMVSCSFWDVESSGQETSAGGIGKTTAEMKNLSSYIDSGWNFDFVWNIDDDYPYIDIDFSYRPTDTNGNSLINISTLNDLRWLSESGYDLDKDWELDKNFDFNNTQHWNCNMGWLPINHFSGTFEGNGFEIHNLNMNQPLAFSLGLFSYSSGTIQNIGLLNVNINGGFDVGGLVGYNHGKIINCYSIGTIKGNDYIGGLIGRVSENGQIINCFSKGAIKGNDYVGGLIGRSSGQIENSYSTALVEGRTYVGGLVGFFNKNTINKSFSKGDVAGANYVGGLVGECDFEGLVKNCYSYVEVSGNDYVGGLIGENRGEIESSFSTGKVTGNNYVGGLMGFNSAKVFNSYSHCTVNGNNYVGGLFGEVSSYPFYYCYSTGKVSGNRDIGGLVGYNFQYVFFSFWDVETSGLETSAGGTGKSTVEMKTKSTFTDVDWDFEVIWSIHPDINDGYPYLLMGNPTSVSEEQVVEQESLNFNVYPNPFAGSLNMEFDLHVEMPISIVLIDNSGKTVKHIHDGMGNAGRNNHIVELTELPSGLYFLILSANGEMLTQKVISVR